MNNLENIIDAVACSERVLMPDRYQQPFIDAFQTVTGCEVPEMNGRKRTIKTANRTFVWFRGRNIPAILGALSNSQPNTKTIGMTGTEWRKEYENTPNTPTIGWQRLGEKKLGTVALIAREEMDIENFRMLARRGARDLGVVTAYPNYVNSIGSTAGCKLIAKVIVDGGVEAIADTLNMPAVDLVCSGETLRENGFVIVDSLLPTYPELLVQTRAAMGVKYESA